MNNYKDAINMLYSEKEQRLVLGLTGRTGAGCSTVAEILRHSFDRLDLEYEKTTEFFDDDEVKFSIIRNYMAENHWEPFEIIEGTCVILSMVFEQADGEQTKSAAPLISYIKELQKDNPKEKFEIINGDQLLEEMETFSYCFEEVKKFPISEINCCENEERIKKYYDLYFIKLPNFRNSLKQVLSKYTCYSVERGKKQDKQQKRYQLYSYMLQKWGNNIRSSGNPFNDNFFQNKIFSFAQRIELFIQIGIKYKTMLGRPTRICIDAIRNANESNYLKDHISHYYLMSVGTDEEERKRRLGELNEEERINLDDVEYSSSYKAGNFFYQQNIAQCFEMADIHIYNPDESAKKFFLTSQLIKYIALMIHPGLVTPTHLERCMQLAYNIKYNSGCLSRQVGAVVTDGDYAVKSVGWNDVPEGQTPCNLRDVLMAKKGNCKNCFSEYEMEDKDFLLAIDNIYDIMQTDSVKNALGGRFFSYCFKDIYNGYTGTKNQVFTRALHAEENAFLQISKYGGQGIKNGKLFCTASPCELCSKKAFQLGIKDIFYIDPYPGISLKHIIHFGKGENIPNLHVFYGAIGEAYISLYKPLIPYKDELEFVSGISCKQVAEFGKESIVHKYDVLDLKYDVVEFSICFSNRVLIKTIERVQGISQIADYKETDEEIYWTGTSFDSVEIEGEGVSVECFQNKEAPYRYRISFDNAKKKGDGFGYTTIVNLKDETKQMHPHFAYNVKHPTEKLILKVIVPNEDRFIENMTCKRYADLDMTIQYDKALDKTVKEESNESQTTYYKEIEHPDLFYTYSLEWEFMNVKKN